MEYHILLVITAFIAICTVAVIVALKKVGLISTVSDSGNKHAGQKGEKKATSIIKCFLRDNDLLFTNVCISFDGKPTELDNVIINSYGVFIIEVKNYVGRIVGNEDDYEWKKYKMTDAGNMYEHTVKNPIKQVKRQIYILAHFLENNGIRVWVSGHVIMLHGNSPVKSSYILQNIDDIEQIIHTPGKTRLNAATMNEIAKLLS